LKDKQHQGVIYGKLAVNLPTNERSTIYDAVHLNNQERNNQYQTAANNSNLWQDNTPAPAGYYTQNK
jgi:hypothetical protein